MNNIFGSVVQQKGFLLENLLQTRVTISIQAKLFETFQQFYYTKQLGKPFKISYFGQLQICLEKILGYFNCLQYFSARFYFPPMQIHQMLGAKSIYFFKSILVINIEVLCFKITSYCYASTLCKVLNGTQTLCEITFYLLLNRQKHYTCRKSSFLNKKISYGFFFIIILVLYKKNNIEVSYYFQWKSFFINDFVCMPAF